MTHFIESKQVPYLDHFEGLGEACLLSQRIIAPLRACVKTPFSSSSATSYGMDVRRGHGSERSEGSIEWGLGAGLDEKAAAGHASGSDLLPVDGACLRSSSVFRGRARYSSCETALVA